MQPALSFLSIALATPLYLLLDSARLLPLSLRDRPWPLLLLLLPILLLGGRAKIFGLALALLSTAALAWTAHARYRLPPSSAAAQLGAPLPDVTLADEAGHPVRLRALGAQPVMLVWFRGSWCPFCKKQLADLAAELRDSSQSFRILAVAPDPQAPLLAMKRDLALPFTLLSDPERQLVSRCELAHCVAILDKEGLVRWQVLSGNWEKDLPARALVQALYRQE